MQWPTISRGNAEVGYASVRNADNTNTVSDGLVMMWAKSGDTIVTGLTLIPGVDVLVCNAVSALVAGISKVAGSSVDKGDYFLLQTFGYHPNVKTDAAALAAGTVLTGHTDVGEAIVGATADEPSARLGVSLKTGASNRAGVMIKCM